MTTPLYVDNGQVITTHSMIQTARRCMNMTRYKYAERLKPKRVTARMLPLKRGTWVHDLLEHHYRGESWIERHHVLTAQFNKLFDEERESLGDLPTECARLMRSYLWHYGANKADPFHGWDVHDTELTLECPWPDGNGIYRCRLDILFEDQFGLWVGDHKTHKTLPSMSFRLRDHASALYIWCAKMNGLDVNGFLWNYIRTKPPTVPAQVYVGTKREGLSTRAIDTDYPTMHRAITAYGYNHADYREPLLALKRDRWRPGVPQTSPFFRWNTLEKDDDMLARVVASAMRTRDRIHGYVYDDTTERTTDRSCDWMCDFKELCETELFGGNVAHVRRQFSTGDPLDYYHDDKDARLADVGS